MSDSYDSLLDDINLMIINILREDSLMPFIEIAKKIGISDGSVHIRVRKLIESGIISKFTISVDNNLVGYRILSFLGIDVEPGFADEATDRLSGLATIWSRRSIRNTRNA